MPNVSVAFGTPASKTFVVRFDARESYLVDCESLERVAPVDPRWETAHFAADGGAFVWMQKDPACKSDEVHVISSTTGKELRHWVTHDEYCSASEVDVSPDASYVITSWRAEAQRPPNDPLFVPQDSHVAYGRDGKPIAKWVGQYAFVDANTIVATYEGDIRAIDLRTGRVARRPYPKAPREGVFYGLPYGSTHVVTKDPVRVVSLDRDRREIVSWDPFVPSRVSRVQLKNASPQEFNFGRAGDGLLSLTVGDESYVYDAHTEKLTVATEPERRPPPFVSSSYAVHDVSAADRTGSHCLLRVGGRNVGLDPRLCGDAVRFRSSERHLIAEGVGRNGRGYAEIWNEAGQSLFSVGEPPEPSCFECEPDRTAPPGALACIEGDDTLLPRSACGALPTRAGR